MPEEMSYEEIMGLAPEILKGKAWTKEADVYSLGTLMNVRKIFCFFCFHLVYLFPLEDMECEG